MRRAALLLLLVCLAGCEECDTTGQLAESPVPSSSPSVVSVPIRPPAPPPPQEPRVDVETQEPNDAQHDKDTSDLTPQNMEKELGDMEREVNAGY